MDLAGLFKLATEAFTRQAGSLFTGSLLGLIAVGALGAAVSWLSQPLGALAGAVGSALLMGGLAGIGLRVTEKKAINATDVFEPATQRPLDYIVVGLAQQAGALLFGVGALITGTLFLFAPILVAEGDDFQTALGRSKDLVLEHLGEVVVFVLAIVVINAVVIGLSCGFGATVSLPFTMLATIRLYHQLTGTPPPDLSIPPPRSSTRPSSP